MAMNVESPLVIDDERGSYLGEKCGIIGVFSPDPTDQLGHALLAAGGVQHRGQNGVGFASWSPTEFKNLAQPGLIAEVFQSDVIQNYRQKSNWTLIHCRYGTDGGYGKENLQPVIVETPTGERVTVIHNGQFTGIDSMRSLLNKNLPDEASDTVIFTHLLAQASNKTWDEKIIHTLSQVTGAYSLLIGVNGALYAARDRFGIRPMIYGQLPGIGWMTASETLAFDKAEGHVVGEILPGEILRFDKNGVTVIQSKSKDSRHLCDFERAYFSHPSSLNAEPGIQVFSWESYAQFRERCGQVIAHESPIANASFVVGVPDSGNAVALGYANALNIPCHQYITRDHFDVNGKKRLFLQDEHMAGIGEKVLGKLLINPSRSAWKDAVVVFGDDTIVRSKVSAEITTAALALGAKEVHWVIGFPPITQKCHLGVSIRSNEELVAARHDANPEKIARAIGATSVRYISPKGFLTARHAAAQELKQSEPEKLFLDNDACGGCVTGIYPITRDGVIYKQDGI